MRGSLDAVVYNVNTIERKEKKKKEKEGMWNVIGDKTQVFESRS